MLKPFFQLINAFNITLGFSCFHKRKPRYNFSIKVYNTVTKRKAPRINLKVFVCGGYFTNPELFPV